MTPIAETSAVSPSHAFALPPCLVVRVLLHCRRWLQRLADALVPARFALSEHAVGLSKTHLLGVAARLRIADILAAAPRTAQELAEHTGSNPEALHRVMRALVASHIFALDAETGRFRNNRLSAALCTACPKSARPFVEYFSSPANVLAWRDVAETVRTGGSAFARVHGMSVWDWFALHPEEERLFAEVMAARSEDDAAVIAAVYPFGEVQSVCDLAGGHGTLLAHVLRAYPHLHGALYEAPGVARLAGAFLQARDVVARAAIIGGNFFQSVPTGYEVYLLKDILHDWDDARALRILTNVRQAMPAGGRILLCETMVEPMQTDLPGALMDVQMLVVCDGGRQRSRQECRGLLQQSGFACARVFRTPLPLSLMEGVAV